MSKYLHFSENTENTKSNCRDFGLVAAIKALRLGFEPGEGGTEEDGRGEGGESKGHWPLAKHNIVERQPSKPLEYWPVSLLVVKYKMRI